jgi:hypothetical protein
VAYAAGHGLLSEDVRRDVQLVELAGRVDDGDGDPAISGRLHLTPKLLDSLLAVENDEDLAARVKELLAAQV